MPTNSSSDSLDSIFSGDFEQPTEVTQFHLPDSELGNEFLKNLVYANVVMTSAEENISAAKISAMPCGDIHPIQILSALMSSYQLLDKVARHFKGTAETLLFPQSVYAFRADYERMIPQRTFEDDGGTTHWYSQAYSKKSAVKQRWQKFWQQHQELSTDLPSESPSDDDFADAFFRIILQLSKRANASLFSDFVKLNESLTASSINQHCQAIEQSLRARIKGQPQAIRAITASEMKTFRRSSRKLRDIFTFAGPSGVGKTELARAYAEALCDATELGFKFRTFNMENYSDEKSALALFGSGSQYTDSALGELTRHAVAYPRTVYLLDEIEKAHPLVIQSLLTLLDSGEAVDSTTQERASFSQSIVIFTTNLGQREFQRSEGMGDLNIFDVLQHATSPHNDKAALTPELVNRLRAGTAVRFLPLHAEALTSIAQMHLQNYQDLTSGTLNYEFGPNMAALALCAGMPNPVPREIANTLDNVITRAQKQLFGLFSEQPDHLDAISTVKISAGAELFAAVAERQLLAYVGNDETVSHQLANHFTAKQFNVVAADSALRDPLSLAAYAVICIDGRHADQDSLAQLIRRLRNFSTQIGVVLLNPSAEQLSDEFIVDSTWMHLDSATLATAGEALANLAKIAETLNLANQKHLACHYDIELERLSRTTATFIACDTKLTPQVSAQRANEGVPGLVTRRPSTRLNDVIGLHRAKQELQRVIRWLEDPSQLKRYNLPMPTGVLLLGPPGTGKTLLARAVAGEVNLPFISLNIGEMLSSLANGTATNLQNAFDAARDVAPCVLFIDEIDALAAKRSEHGDASERSHNAAVNTLLTQLDGLQKAAEPIFVIAATNRAEALDPAVTRSGRLDHPILCDIPNREDRCQFVRFYMNKYNLSFSDKEIADLATQTSGMSGADMEQVFITTLYNAVSQLSDNDHHEHPVSVAAVRNAITYIRYGAPSNIELSREAKLQTATHEAGHLLVQKVLLPHEHVTIATIEPRNRALGFISTSKDENSQPQTVAEVKAKLAVLMAGREAEQLMYGSAGINGGASSDLQHATRLATYAICTLGLDSEFGLISYGDRFFELAAAEERKLASQRIHFWLNEARDRARKLLLEQREKLEFISQELCEKESVYQPDIEHWFA